MESIQPRLMICQDGGSGRARVIGSLSGEAVRILLDAVEGGATVLDVSEVDQADDTAVRALAELWPGRCTLVDCPRWLELWLDRVREEMR